MLAVLPAGGRSNRFGGIYKELLPIGEHLYVLQQALRRARAMGAGKLLLISSAEKVSTHMQFIRTHVPDLAVHVMVRREEEEDLWSGIRPVLDFREDCLLILPDTVFDKDAKIPVGADLAFGTFVTDQPERFSVVDIAHKKIITKPPPDYYAGPVRAWGCVYWSRRVGRFWQDTERVVPYATYDAAFQDAMEAFDPQVFGIEDYHDLGTWEAYQSFVIGNT